MERLIKQAYGRRKPAPLDDQWQTKVMHSILTRGPLRARTGFFDVFGHVVWRLAPVSCVLIAVLTACTFYLDVLPDYEMASIFLEHPVEFTLMESLGI